MITLAAAPAQAGPGTAYETRVFVIKSGPAKQLYNKQFGIRVQLQAKSGDQWLAVDDSGEQLTLQRKLVGTSTWQDLKTQEASSTDGTTTFSTKVVANADYRVNYPGGTLSSDETVIFNPSVSDKKAVKAFRAFGAKSKDLAGRKFRFFGKMSPSFKNKPIVLQRNTGGKWQTYARAKTNKQSQWGFTVPAKPSRGKWRYRVYTAKGQQFQLSYSPTLILCTNVPC